MNISFTGTHEMNYRLLEKGQSEKVARPAIAPIRWEGIPPFERSQPENPVSQPSFATPLAYFLLISRR
jgi:hypothetical protein